MTASEPTARFDCFISYSRRDSAFADQLHRALARYTPPKGVGATQRRLSIFRDSSDIQGTEYHQAIEAHLQESRSLIIVCSPDAAASIYVNDEIERFVHHHGTSRIIPVLLRGLPNNEAKDEKDSAFPPALVSALAMPLAVDYRPFTPGPGRVDSDAFHTQWMMLLANVLQVPRAEIEQREAKRRRAVRRTWSMVVTAIVAALSGLALWALIEGERALVRQLAAQAAVPGSMVPSEVEQRVLLGREALLRERRLNEHSLEVDSALRDALTALPRKRISLPTGTGAIAFTADGSFAVAAQAKELVVYSLADTQVVHRLALNSPVTQLQISNDLRYVAALDAAGGLTQWHWPTFEEIDEAPPEVKAAPLACFVASGKAITALRADSKDTQRFELLHWLAGADRLLERTEFRTAEPAFPLPGNNCQLLTHENKVADTQSSGGLTAWQWTPRDLSIFAASNAVPPDLAPQPVRQWSNVKLLAVADKIVVVHGDGAMRHYSSTSSAAEEIKEVSISNATALSANGLWLAATSSFEDPYVPLLHPTRIDFIDTATGVSTRSIAAHAGRGAFTPDASAYLTYSGHRISKWDRRLGLEQQRITAAFPVANIEFDPSSRFLVAYSKEGAAEIYDLGAADEIARSTNRVRLATTDLVGPPIASTAKPSLDPVATLRDQVFAGEAIGYVNSLESSPQGRFAVLGVTRSEPWIKVGLPDGLELAIVENNSPPTLRFRSRWGVFRFNADASLLLIDGDDGVARMISTATGTELWRYKTTTRNAWDADRALALSDDGRIAALTTSKGIGVVSGVDGQLIFEATSPSVALALSPNGEMLARQDGKDSIVVQRVIDQKIIASLQAQDVGDLRALMFSASGNLLLGIGGTRFSTFMSSHFVEEHAVLWDVASGERLSYVPSSWRPLADYEEQIGSAGDEAQLMTAMIWSHHSKEFGGRLFSSLLNYWAVPADLVGSTLVVWRLTDEGVQETYRGSSSELLTPVALSSRGGSVILQDSDSGYQRLVSFKREHLLHMSCEVLSNTMSASEQNRWLPGGRTPMGCP